MVRFLPILVALFLGSAAAQDNGISACSAGCISQVFSDTTKLACAANDKVCACNSPDFWYGIRDCIVQACGSEDLDGQLQDAQTASNAQCDVAKASAGVPATASTTSVPTTVAPTAPSTTTTTSPSPSPTINTAADTTSPSPSSTAQSTTSTVAAEEATTSAAAASTLRSTSTTSSQSSNVSKTSTSVPSSSTSAASAVNSASGADVTSSSEADDATSDSSSGDLSVAAKAGIGAGAGVALLLSALIAFYICAKKRKGKQDPARIPTMQISRPLPGSGRQYAHDLEAAKVPSLSTQFRNDLPAPIQAAKYSPSTVSSQYSPRSLYAPSRPSREDDYHDVQGRRYEDMLPRTQPKTML